MKAFAIFALAVVAAVPAHAGNCYSTFGYSAPYYRKAAYVAPVVQQIYFVGAPLASAAIVEAERRADPDWAAFQAWRAGQQQGNYSETPNGSLAQQSPAAADSATPPLQSVTSCSRCHSGAEPKGGLTIDGKAFLSPANLKAIKAKLLAGEMPPPKSPEANGFEAGQAGAVMAESVDLLGEAEAEQPIPAGAMP